MSEKSLTHIDVGCAGTSPRLLKGSNAQEVFSNTGEICCDTTSAAGWKQAGAMAISKEVDISVRSLILFPSFLRSALSLSCVELSSIIEFVICRVRLV